MKVFPSEIILNSPQSGHHNCQLSIVNCQLLVTLLEQQTGSYDTLMFFLRVAIAPFSSRDTCAWEIPKVFATSIWVLLS